MAQGIYVSPNEFVRFADPEPASLSREIAVRGRSLDFYAFGMFLPNPDPVLKKQGLDIRVYRDLRSDAHVGGCIRRRKAALLSLEHGLDRDNARSRVHKNVEAILADLPLKRIMNQMADALLYGYQPMEILWGKVGAYIVPVDIQAKPPEWFVFTPDTNELRFRSRDHMMLGEELPPRKFLLPRQDPTYQNPYGFPDLSMCFWPIAFKKGGLKFWVTFAEKYGMPWAIGKHPRGAPENEIDDLIRSLDGMVQDAVAAIPDDSSVELLTAQIGTGTGDIYKELVMFCRSEVSIALLGQDQTTEKDTNRASAKIGIDVVREIRDGDARIVEEAMNTLIRWIVELNFGNATMPAFGLWEQEEVDKTIAERDGILARSMVGYRFTRAYFERIYDLQPGDLEPTDEAPPTGYRGKVEEADGVTDYGEGGGCDGGGFGGWLEN